MQVRDLTAVFDLYYDRLVYFCFKILADKEQSRDITQDAFLKYWQQADSVAENEVAIKNFLYSTVHNAALNVLRHSKVIGRHVEHQGKEEPSEPDVMETIISSEVIAEIHFAIESLPAQYKQIAKMCFFEGKKNQVIADELNMSINTVKKQKQKTLELLRLKLKPEIFALFLCLF